MLQIEHIAKQQNLMLMKTEQLKLLIFMRLKLLPFLISIGNKLESATIKTETLKSNSLSLSLKRIHSMGSHYHKYIYISITINKKFIWKETFYASNILYTNLWQWKKVHSINDLYPAFMQIPFVEWIQNREKMKFFFRRIFKHNMWSTAC